MFININSDFNGKGDINNFLDKDNETICFKGFEESLCLPPKIYKQLENKIRLDFKLKSNYPLSKEKIIELLKLDASNIEKKIINYLKDNKLTIYYKSFIDNVIETSGLYCSTIINVLNKLKIIYPELKFVEVPVFTDMKSTHYNYMDFNKYPPFNNNTIYFLPLLNISSTENTGHWCSLIIFKNENMILYYDSLNKKLKYKQYIELIDKFNNYLKEINNKYPIQWRNNKQTQYDNSYCGIYMINFLITCLTLYKNKELNNLKKLNDLTQNIINEKVIEDCITNFLVYQNN